jgi:hypothetical protein
MMKMMPPPPKEPDFRPIFPQYLLSFIISTSGIPISYIKLVASEETERGVSKILTIQTLFLRLSGGIFLLFPRSGARIPMSREGWLL